MPIKTEPTKKTATPSAYSTEKELYATRYKQGTRTVYGVAMTPAQIASTVKKPDPEAENPGNRRIRLKHAEGFARYFIENDNWVAPGIILRAPNIFTFNIETEVADVQFGIVAYPERSQGDIHILDGQHRILGMHIALEQIDKMLEVARNHRMTAKRVGDGIKEAEAEITRLERVRDRLYTERVSVEIQVTDDIDAYRQMFFDIAENALGITASVKARFDTRKVLNRSLPLVLDHPLIKERIDLQLDRLQKTTPFLITARHLTETVRVAVVGFDGRISRRQEKEMKEQQIAKTAEAFFTILTEAFPALKSVQLGQLLPDDLRKSSMLGSPLFLRILAGVYYDLTVNHSWGGDDVLAYFKRLAPHVNATAHANSIWQTQAPINSFPMDAWSPSGRRQDAKALVVALIEWALDKPAFLDAAPLPAPEVPEVEEQIDYAPFHDTKAIEVEIRNEMEDISAAAKKAAPKKSGATRQSAKKSS